MGTQKKAKAKAGRHSMFNYKSEVVAFESAPVDAKDMRSADSMKGIYGPASPADKFVLEPAGDYPVMEGVRGGGIAPIPEAHMFPFKHSGGTNPTYFVDRDLKISHLELMVGGNIPESTQEKDHLIRRLRIFISKLNVNLEQSEGKHK